MAIFLLLPSLILTLTIQSSTSFQFSQEVQLKGGLIFKPEGLAQINQDSTQFFRSLDTSSLTQLAQKSFDSINLYSTFCDIIKDLNLRTSDNSSSHPSIRYVKTASKHKLSEAEHVCMGLNSRLPEIRDRNTFSSLTEYAFRNRITKIYAGLYYDSITKKFRFVSDKKDAYNNDYFKDVYYGGRYNGAFNKGSWDDSYVQYEAKDYPVFYVSPNHDWKIKIADHNDLNTEDYVICEQTSTPVTRDPQHNYFTQMAHHACNRDFPNLQSSTQYAIKELQAITTLNFSLIQDPPAMNTFFPEIIHSKTDIKRRRSKRDAVSLALMGMKQPASGNTGSFHIKQALNKCQTILQNITAQKENLEKEDNQDAINSMVHFEDMKIHSPFELRTIPDLVVALRAFWTYLCGLDSSLPPFNDWMLQQAVRSPIYAKFRNNVHIPTLQKRFVSNIDTLINSIDHSNISDTDYLKLIDQIELIQNQTEHHSTYYDSIILDQLPFLIEKPNEEGTIKRRQKRAIPLIIGGILAASATTFVGMEIGKNLNQAQLYAPDPQTLEVYKQFSTKISDLEVNENQIKNAINSIAHKLQEFEKQIIGNFEGTMSVTMELDLKMLIRYQQQVIQTTVLKYNQILLAASHGRTSPFVLPQQELLDIAAQHAKDKSFILSPNLEDVKCFTMIENNTINFVLQIPILDPQKQFSLFTVTSVPSFTGGSAHIPEPDSNHVAINMNGDKYTTLSDLELNKCLAKPPDCKSTKPISPISDQTSCVASTYTTDSHYCPFKPFSSKTTTFVRFHDLDMVYSTKETQRIFIKCFDPSNPARIRDDTIILKNSGLMKVKHSCDITLPDGTTHKTPRIPNRIDLSNKLFSEVKTIDPPSPEQIDLTNDRIFNNIPDLQETPISKFNFNLQKSFSSAIQSSSSISIFTIIIILLLLTFIIIIIIVKCCPSCYQRPLRIIQDKRVNFNVQPPPIITDNWFTDDLEDEPPTLRPIFNTDLQRARWQSQAANRTPSMLPQGHRGQTMPNPSMHTCPHNTSDI